MYTYELPYGARRQLCNLLDADQSWRGLAGEFAGLDGTQLALLGQAHLRNGSPGDELLSRLDSANVRVGHLCEYLARRAHWRALELLQPFAGQPGPQVSSLHTPTPSFAEMRLEGGSGDLCQRMLTSGDQEWTFEASSRLAGEPDVQQQPSEAPPRGPSASGGACHRSRPAEVASVTGQQQSPNAAGQLVKASVARDPGEEIVRLACASNRKRTSIGDQHVVNQLRLIMQISYEELRQATGNFSQANVVGNGGFACVYRCHWKGTDVAIKRLKCDLMDQALNELTILNSYRIDNILPIYGISIDGPQACLVYQFMANGSLEDRLACRRQTRALSWRQRALIGDGVARALFYLHTLRDKPLVHGDVKSANVLLDGQFVPKLGDFGLARQVFRGAGGPGAAGPTPDACTHCTVSSIHGTSVYLPPEYLRHRILSPAVDVYSYGVVLLELATGRRAYDGQRLLVDSIADELQAGSGARSRLADWRLSGEPGAAAFELLLGLGLECAHVLKKRRPDMGQVLSRFAGAGANPNSPLEPQQQQLPHQQRRPGRASEEAFEPSAAADLAAMSVERLAAATDTQAAIIPLLTELGVGGAD